MLPTQLMMRGLIVHCKGHKLIKNQIEVNINQICWFCISVTLSYQHSRLTANEEV